MHLVLHGDPLDQDGLQVALRSNETIQAVRLDGLVLLEVERNLKIYQKY